MAIEKLIRHKSPGIGQIPAELIKAVGRTILPESHKFIILFGIRRNCTRSGRSRSLYIFIGRVIRYIVVNYRSISLLSTTYKILSNILLSSLSPYEIIGNHQRGSRRYRSTTYHIFCVC